MIAVLPFACQTFKAYNAGAFALTRVLIPAWIVHYYAKYHLGVSTHSC